MRIGTASTRPLPFAIPYPLTAPALATHLVHAQLRPKSRRGCRSSSSRRGGPDTDAGIASTRLPRLCRCVCVRCRIKAQQVPGGARWWWWWLDVVAGSDSGHLWMWDAGTQKVVELFKV